MKSNGKGIFNIEKSRSLNQTFGPNLGIIHFKENIGYQMGSNHVLSLKFRPHRATRAPHHQHRKTVIHGTRINSTAHKKGQNYTKLAKKLKSASRPGKTSACAHYIRTSSAYARLWGEKPARLPNGAFMKLVGLPTTIGSAPKSI